MHKPSGTFKLDINGKYGKKGSYYVRFKFPDPITGNVKKKQKVDQLLKLKPSQVFLI